MSYPLVSLLVNIPVGGTGLYNLLNLGNVGQAFTDITISGINLAATAAGIVKLEADIEAQYTDPSYGLTVLPFMQVNWFAMATAAGEATNNIQLGPNQWIRHFPSPLLMPNGSQINLNITSLVNCPGANISVDISGFTYQL